MSASFDPVSTFSNACAHFERMVFRLHAAHIEKIAAGSSPSCVEYRSAVDLADLGAVGNEVARFPVPFAVIALDGSGVRDHGGRAECGQPLRDQIPGLGEPVPLLALPFDAIDVERHRDAEHARPERENGIRAVAVERHVHPMRQQMHCRNQGMRDGIEIFVADGGQIFQPHAAIHGLRIALAAIDRHLMTAGREPRGEFLGKRFEAAVIGWNPSGAEQGDAHELRLGGLGAR